MKGHSFRGRDVLLTLAVVIALLLIYGFYNFTQMEPLNTVDHPPVGRDPNAHPRVLEQIIALQAQSPDKPIRVLSVDGGGVRGILPARVLHELEKKTGKPTSELFDMFIGASSGAITIASLNLPDEDGNPRYTAEDVLNLYSENSGQIFHSPFMHQVMSMDGLIGPKFLAKSKHEVFKTTAGDTKYRELIRPVMIPALDYLAVHPVLFRNWSSDRDYYVADILSGATSPPALFSPIEVASLDHTRRHVLVDGALFLDNPAIEAWIEANKLFPNAKFLIVSLGTGYLSPDMMSPKSKDWGVLQWSSELVSLLLSSSNRFIDHRMGELLLTKEYDISDYYRFNLPLDPINANAFSGAADNMVDVKSYAEKLVADNQDKLDELANQLVQN